jgi:nucleoside-diphosphate kinase
MLQRKLANFVRVLYAFAPGIEPKPSNQVETTLILFKPDALHRGLVGQVLSRFEAKGLQLVGMRLMRMTQEIAAEHYAEHVDKPFYPGLVGFMTSSPIIAMALRGPKAVAVARKLMGATFGIDAEAGTIRGDFGCSKSYNLVHGSDSPESAARELGIYFPDGLEDWDGIQAPWLWDDGK